MTVAPRLLLIEDDAGLAAMLREFLELQGFQVEIAASGELGLSALERQRPDLIILDVMLPGISGFETLERIRQQVDVPVIMATARGEESERIIGLMSGADDYLPKPFNPLELAVRIRAVLRRAQRPAEPPAADDVLTIGPIRLDLRRCEVHAGTVPVTVTAAELRVLETLMRHADEVMSRTRLTELALQRPIEAYDRSIDTLISRLRRKLADAGVVQPTIRGLRGHGYVLDTAGTRA
jgi:two-component system response regulator CpxR